MHFQYPTLEISQNSSKRINRVHNKFHLGLGRGIAFEKATVEINSYIVIDDSSTETFKSEQVDYTASGYALGFEVNKYLTQNITIGGGLYFNRYLESASNPSSPLTAIDTKINTLSATVQVKTLFLGIRPFLRISLGDALHNYQFILGVNLIDSSSD